MTETERITEAVETLQDKVRGVNLRNLAQTQQACHQGQ